MELWRVLGYDRTAAGIAEVLAASEMLVLIEGPPGVGKSWLAAEIGELWESGGGRAALVEGDFLRADASLYPFSFVTSGARRLRSLGEAVAGVARAVEAFAGTAGLIVSAVQAAAKARDLHRRERAPFLGDPEQKVLHELERLAKRAPLLLIADNLHWWDAMSLAFLHRLRDERTWAAFPFLAGVRVIAVQTTEPYQSVMHPEAHEALLAPMRTARFSLPRIERRGYEHVLVALGAPAAPPAKVTDAIYSMSGGNLALARRCAERLGRDEHKSLLGAADAGEFADVLITERMRALGVQGKRAIALLQLAAMLGSTFRRDEIFCASPGERDETLKLLRYCRSEGLLEVVGGLDRFVHDVFRQYFLRGSGADRAAICDRLADCFRTLRPAEYEIRCLNALGAEDDNQAATLAVHAALQYEREGRASADLPPAILAAMTDGGLVSVAEQLLEAVCHLRAARYDSCLSHLDQLPRRMSKSLMAEADWLRAMCLMSTRDEDDRAHGRLILESWDGYVDEEPELGVRLMQQLLYGLYHVADKDAGWVLERRIVRILSARVGIDPAAEDALYVLDRCAGGLHPPDVTLVRVREAAEHFAPAPGDTVMRRPVEYYRCLLNLGASLVENAHFDEAAEVCDRAIALVGAHTEGAFPYAGWAHGNQVLAEYRAGRLTAAQAAARQRVAVAQDPRRDDPYFLESALGVYVALAGNHDEALEVFTRLDAQLTATSGTPEPSMVYLLRANRCVVRWLIQPNDDAVDEWRALRAVVASSNYLDRDILLRRHELLTDILAAGDPMTAREFDVCLLDSQPSRFGPLWRSFGHGFVLPALHIWREN